MPPTRRDREWASMMKSSGLQGSGGYSEPEDPNEGSIVGDLKVIGFGILGLAIGLGLAALMAGAGRISVKAVILAVGGVFIGGAALVFGTISLFLRICLPSIRGETRSAIVIGSVLLLIVAIIV